MNYNASCDLECELFKNVFDKTPDYIKNNKLMDFSNEGEFTFTLKREHLYPYDEKIEISMKFCEFFFIFSSLPITKIDQGLFPFSAK